MSLIVHLHFSHNRHWTFESENHDLRALCGQSKYVRDQLVNIISIVKGSRKLRTSVDHYKYIRFLSRGAALNIDFSKLLDVFLYSLRQQKDCQSDIVSPQCSYPGCDQRSGCIVETCSFTETTIIYNNVVISEKTQTTKLLPLQLIKSFPFHCQIHKISYLTIVIPVWKKCINYL